MLGTPQQLAAERLLLKLLEDPQVKAAQAKARAELLSDPSAANPEGLARLDHAIMEFTASLIMESYSADPNHPILIWTVDNTPRAWFGHEFPGSAIAGDSPDNLYRSSGLEGSGHYEILGRVDPRRRVSQLSFQLRRGQSGKPPLQEPGKILLGNQVATLTDREMQFAPDGTFRISIGVEAGGPNHLKTEPGPLLMTVRDTMSDWAHERPARLVINRLDPAPVPPRDDAAFRLQILEDLPGYVRYWGGYHNHFLGGLKSNVVFSPIPREGGWGYNSGARYHLAPDEAAVLTIASGAARYAGLQVGDLWMVGSDARQHLTSLNLAQSAPNPDGTFTYVISPKDPGVANWLDTDGLHDGYLVLRWQGLEPGVVAGDLLRGFRIVKLADLAKGNLAVLPRVSPAQRKAQVAQHAAEYRSRADETP